MQEKQGDFSSCALGYTISLLKGKWEPYIVWYLDAMPGKRAGYSKLRKSIPYELSHKMFIQHLGKLEEAGVIDRIVTETKPLRVDYALTDKGVSFANVLSFLRDWGAVYGEFSDEVALRSRGMKKNDLIVYGHLPESGDSICGGGQHSLVYQGLPESACAVFLLGQSAVLARKRPSCDKRPRKRRLCEHAAEAPFLFERRPEGARAVTVRI